jgi:peroxiredoxin
VNGGACDHLRRGTAVPRLILPATDGTKISPAELRGQSLIAIYPWTGRPGLPNPPNWDDIPGAHGSTPELEGFRDLAAEFAKLDVALFGLSGQTTDYQREMATRLSLPFPILSDHQRHFATELTLPTFETGGEVYLKRVTLLVKNRCIERVFYPVADPSRHASEVLHCLEQAAGSKTG